MNRQYADENWIEIFENYYCGMSQRELEKKYFPMTIKTISRTCKMVMVNMMTNPQSTIRDNWHQINKEIESIIGDINKNG
jgi:hypothetical protein